MFQIYEFFYHRQEVINNFYNNIDLIVGIC